MNAVHIITVRTNLGVMRITSTLFYFFIKFKAYSLINKKYFPDETEFSALNLSLLKIVNQENFRLQNQKGLALKNIFKTKFI